MFPTALFPSTWKANVGITKSDIIIRFSLIASNLPTSIKIIASIFCMINTASKVKYSTHAPEKSPHVQKMQWTSDLSANFQWLLNWLLHK